MVGDRIGAVLASSQQTTPVSDLFADERWQLIQRIVSSPAFHRSARLRDLLLHVSERTLHSQTHELTEQQIGEALFHKPAGYRPVEDSSVRVHARQLRLKLHEYFDGAGRNELLVVEIPKGSYVPTFRRASIVSETSDEIEAMSHAPVRAPARTGRLGWALAGVLGALCVVLAITRGQGPAVAATAPPWPFSAVFDKRHQTIVVVADSNYGMQRLLTGNAGSLGEYLQGDFTNRPEVAKLNAVNSPFREYLVQSSLTSFADVFEVVSLMKMAGPFRDQMTVRYPRDLRIRDLDHDNFVFIGSPGSNPWVSLFQDRLNFHESEARVGQSAKMFVNTKPLAGELPGYEGLRSTGAVGEDYATISLLPNLTHDGNVLILQGLQQEGTEAAGRFLADDVKRNQLRNALGSRSRDPVWFEALIRSRTVSGAPSSTSLIVVRRIQ